MGDQVIQARTVLSRYLAELRSFRPLGREEERRLLREVSARRPGALNRLIESNLSFVVKIASEYRSMGLPFEDLLNEGNLGLIEAAHRFDPDRDVKFITYAVWWVRRAIRRALTDQVRAVRVPEYHIEQARQVNDVRVCLRQALGRDPTHEEICARSSVTAGGIARLLHFSFESLDRTIGEDDASPLVDKVESGGNSPEQSVLTKEAIAELIEAFAELDPQQKAVLVLRLGLHEESPLTLRAIGVRMGLSRERIRQIEQATKARLRKLVLRHRLKNAPASPPRRTVRRGNRCALERWTARRSRLERAP